MQPDVAPEYMMHRGHRSQSLHDESKDGRPPYLTQNCFLLMGSLASGGDRPVYFSRKIQRPGSLFVGLGPIRRDCKRVQKA